MMLQCPNFWISMRRVVSLIGSLHRLNAAVRQTKNETDAMRASHYEWYVTRMELLKKISAIKLRVLRLSSGTPVDSGLFEDASDPSRQNSPSVSGKWKQNQDEAPASETIPLIEGCSETGGKEDVLPTVSYKVYEPCEDLGGLNNIPLSSITQTTEAEVDPSHSEERSVSHVSDERSKLDDEKDCKNSECGDVRESSGGESGTGCHDGLCAKAPEALLVTGSVLSDVLSFPHCSIFGEDLKYMALTYARNSSYDFELTFIFCQTCRLLELDEKFTKTLVEQFAVYQNSCYELLYCLSCLQNNNFLYDLISEIIQKTFPPFSFSLSIVEQYKERKLPPVDILADILARMRRSRHFEPLKGLMSTSERNVHLLSLNKFALWRTMLERNHGYVRLMCKLFFGFDEETLKDVEDTKLFYTWLNYLDTDSHHLIYSRLRDEFERFHGRRRSSPLFEFLDNIEKNILEALSGYECVEKMLLTEPRSFYNVANGSA